MKMSKALLLSKIEEKYSEHLEMSDNPDRFLKHILVNLLADSLDELEYYKKLWNKLNRKESENVCRCDSRLK